MLDHSKQEIKVQFWHAMGDRGHQELLRKFADDYMASHPGVKVEPVFQGLYGNLYQKLIAAVTSRHPPAMAQMFESWTTRLYDRGRLDSVQNYLDGPNGYSPEELADFFPAFLEDNRWGKTLVTLPFNKSAFLLQYNVNLFKRAGIDAAPQSWQELRRAARAISQLKSDDGQPCWGMLVRPQLEAFTTFYFSAGGEFLDAERRPLMQSPTADQTLKFLCGLIHQDKAALVDSNYPATLFGTGRLGMFVHSSAAFPFNDKFVAGKFEWRAVPLPPPEGDSPAGNISNRKTLFQGMNIGILADNPPEVRAAAWDFLKFILQPERSAAWAMQTGYCSVRRSALDVPAFRDYLKDHPNHRAVIAEIEHGAFEPKPDFWESWRTDVGNEFASALMGFQTPDKALASAQRDGEDALKYDSKFP